MPEMEEIFTSSSIKKTRVFNDFIDLSEHYGRKISEEEKKDSIFRVDTTTVVTSVDPETKRESVIYSTKETTHYENEEFTTVFAEFVEDENICLSAKGVGALLFALTAERGLASD